MTSNSTIAASPFCETCVQDVAPSSDTGKKCSGRPSAFRPDIEGLRGIAVLLVVAFHYGIPGFSGGFVGVDVFFVLSGYLITGILVAEIEKTSRLNLLEFYARRVRRLLPACALMLLVTLLVCAALMAPNELSLAGRAARATSLYMSNIFFSINAADYFSPDVKSNPMLHTWSLAVEEQFYLLWPLLILLGMQFYRSKKILILLLAGLTASSLVISIWFTARGGTFAFYELPARAWEFGGGGLAVLLPRKTIQLPRGWGLALGWLGILAIAGSGHFISGDADFPGWIALIPVLGTVAVLVAGAEHSKQGAGVALRTVPLQTLGTLSYSWYLWHWPFLVFAAVLFPNLSIAGKVATAVASLAVAGVTHYFVENPIRTQRYLIQRPAFSLALAAAVMFFSVSASLVSMRLASHLASAPQMKAIDVAVADIASMPRQQCVNLGESADLKTCIFGNTSSETNIILFGDSHAIQWFNPLLQIAESHGWKLTTLVKSGCPAADVRTPGSSTAFAVSCSSWRAEALRRIVGLRPSIVFIGNASNYFSRKDVSGSRFGVSPEEWQDGTRRTLKTLTAAGLRIVAMRDNPSSSWDIPTCLARSVRHPWHPGGSCEMDKSTSLDPAVFEAEKAGASGLPNVHFIDMTDWLCQKDACWTVQAGAVMYRDNNHLTGTFANTLAPVLNAELLSVVFPHP
jgi:peptidoglycan/LPS O-acetylase OafA/YrhL